MSTRQRSHITTRIMACAWLTVALLGGCGGDSGDVCWRCVAGAFGTKHGIIDTGCMSSDERVSELESAGYECKKFE